MDIHQKFIALGRQRNKITYELLNLLPEIYEKEIYREKGYLSIFEYAGVLAGLSHSVVEKTLRTAKHLEGKPHLQKAVKTQGIHKVALVATLATEETDEAWADKVCNMNKTSLAELARELRPAPGNRRQENPIPGDGISKESRLCKASEQKINIELDNEMQFLFLSLKKKLKTNLSNKEALRQMLVMLANKKTAKNRKSVKRKIVTRYIPAKIRQEALAKNNGKCAYPDCNKPYDLFHHREYFSDNKSHESIAPLCKEHHDFAHNGLIENAHDKPKNWRIKLNEAPQNLADMLFRKYRQS